MLFGAGAVIDGAQFNSCNFMADFGCSTEKLRKEPLQTKSIQFQFRVWNVLGAYVTKTFEKLSMCKMEA